MEEINVKIKMMPEGRSLVTIENSTYACSRHYQVAEFVKEHLQTKYPENYCWFNKLKNIFNGKKWNIN